MVQEEVQSKKELTLEESQEQYKKSIIENRTPVRYEPGEVEEILEQAREKLPENVVNQLEKETGDNFRVLTYLALKNYESPNYTWRVQNIIQDKKIGILAGSSATFKSWLALNLSLCVATGKPFLDNFTVEQGAVLFIDRENSIPELQNRVEMIVRGMDILPETEIPLYFISEQSLKLDNKEGNDFLKTFISEKKVRLVIGDVYRRLISFEENDANSVNYFFTDCIKPICEETGCSFIFIHHHKKGKSDNDEKEMLRGSSDLVNYVDGVIQVTRKGTKLVVKQTKNRSGKELEPFELNIETDEQEYFRFKYLGKKRDTSMLAKSVETLLLWISENEIKQFETEIARTYCFKKGIKKQMFYEGIEELVKRGLLEKISRGNYIVSPNTQDSELVHSPLYKSGGLVDYDSQSKSESPESPIGLSGLSGLSKVKAPKKVVKKKSKEKADRQKQFLDSEDTADIKTTCTKDQVLTWIKDNPGKSYKLLYETLGEGSLRFKNELVSEGLIVMRGDEMEVVKNVTN